MAIKLTVFIYSINLIEFLMLLFYPPYPPIPFTLQVAAQSQAGLLHAAQMHAGASGASALSPRRGRKGSSLALFGQCFLVARGKSRRIGDVEKTGRSFSGFGTQGALHRPRRKVSDSLVLDSVREANPVAPCFRTSEQFDSNFKEPRMQFGLPKSTGRIGLLAPSSAQRGGRGVSGESKLSEWGE